MSFEQLQEMWARQPVGEVRQANDAALLEKVKSDAEEFDRVIARRDRREIIAGWFLTICYAIPLRHATGPSWAYWASFVPLLGLTLGFMWLRWYIQQKRRDFGTSLTGELNWSIYHTALQIRLLVHVAWWYLLPIIIAAFLHATYRHGLLTPADWWVGGITLLSCAIVYWFNQRVVRTKLTPQLEKLVAIRQEWNTLSRE